LFDINEEKKPKGNPESVQGRSPSAAQADTKKQEEIRGLSGYSGIDDVRNAAPDKSGTSDSSGDTRGSGRTRSTSSASAAPATSARGRKAYTEAQEEAKKAERKQKALDTAGKTILGKAAAVPYDAWAAFAAEPFLRLSEEEQKELADAYFEIAQAFDIDFSNKWLLLGGMCMFHINIIGVRMKMLADKEELERTKKKREEPMTVGGKTYPIVPGNPV
jgi:hypothetical protein